LRARAALRVANGRLQEMLEHVEESSRAGGFVKGFILGFEFRDADFEAHLLEVDFQTLGNGLGNGTMV
jgi:hypothetical protein